MEIIKLSKKREEFAKTVGKLQKNVNQLMIQSQTPQPKAHPSDKESESEDEKIYQDCNDPQSIPE